MEALQWIPAILAGAAALFVMGSIVWAVFDILGETRLTQTARVLWVVLMFAVPLFGILAWLFAKPRLSTLPR
ncbi:PLDc N-terminal domain-containing protein [Paenarthrobacter sp. NPDC057981]|uniref:PLDc N-terminal domain-containing protein n=1 Tax=Paenarthrobacter sp. NPDC057981 TaxID=3346297 RepID=UPI0036D8B548